MVENLKQKLSEYFNGIWKDTNYEYLEHSGYSLVDYINNQKPSSVLDVGCGYNKLKDKIHNLVGIDPFNDAADIKVSIENYKSAPYDIAGWDQFIEWYQWTPEKIYSIAEQYKYGVECLKMEYTKEKDLRYFFIYTK